jgi:hypothetical protein
MRASAEKGWRIVIGRSFARLALRSVAKALQRYSCYSYSFVFPYTLPQSHGKFCFLQNEIHREKYPKRNSVTVVTVTVLFFPCFSSENGGYDLKVKIFYLYI